METTVALAGAALFLAAFIETLVESLLGAHYLPFEVPEWMLRVMPLVLGVIFAFAYGIDLVTPFLAEAKVQAGGQAPQALSLIMSGLTIGRGSHAVHQLLGLSAKKGAVK